MKRITQDFLAQVIRKTIQYFLFGMALLAGQSSAQSFCFASASSYYEQVYCELQARGEAKTLPPFYQFKRNDATTQALLLKRPAGRIGIELPMPKSTAKKLHRNRHRSRSENCLYLLSRNHNHKQQLHHPYPRKPSHHLLASLMAKQCTAAINNLL